MSKGDQIAVVVRGINGPMTMTARQNGRTVEYTFETESKVNWIVVKELTRGGTVVAEHRYPADEVLMLAREAKEIE